MKTWEGVTAAVMTGTIYMIAPDVLNRIQTIFFFLAVWGMCVAVIWTVEELHKRYRRMIWRRTHSKRVFYNIDLRNTGYVEVETGKEVNIIA